MTPVRLEPATPRSRVKHSTTEPLRSPSAGCSNLEASKCIAKGVDQDQTANEAVSDLGPYCLHYLQRLAVDISRPHFQPCFRLAVYQSVECSKLFDFPG